MEVCVSVWQLPCIRREATSTSLFSEKIRRNLKAFLLVSSSKRFLCVTRLVESICGAQGICSFPSSDFSSVFFIIPTEVWEIVHNKKIWQFYDSVSWVSSQDIMMVHRKLSAYIACAGDFGWWKTIWRPQSLKIVRTGELLPEGIMMIQ